MDYWERLSLSVVDSLEEALLGVPKERIFCLTTKGSSYYGERELPLDGTYIFGAESKGLPQTVLDAYSSQCLYIPMIEGTRSLNLATSVGIVMYEVARQNYKTLF